MTTMTMANYIVLDDANFTLAEDEEKTFMFTLPDDFLPDSRAVLAYIANPNSDAPMDYQIDVNGQLLRRATFANSTSRGLWEVFSGSQLDAIGENNIQFRFEAGNGFIIFRDIVLWFQQSVTL